MKIVKHIINYSIMSNTPNGYIGTIHSDVWYNLLQQKHRLKPVCDLSQDVYRQRSLGNIERFMFRN